MADEKKRLSASSLTRLVAAKNANQHLGMRSVPGPNANNDDGSRPDMGFGGVEMEEGEEEENLKKDIKFKSNVGAGIAPNTLLDPLALSNQLLAEQLGQVLSGKCHKLVWRAAEVREHLRLLWQRESTLLKQLVPLFDEEQLEFSTAHHSPIDVLFIETVMVEPSRFRPIRFLAGQRYEHPATVNLRRLLEANQLIGLVRLHLQSNDSFGDNAEQPHLGLTAKELIENRIQGKTLNEKLHNSYLELQMRANCLYDQRANRTDGLSAQPGLKQVLEKKEGLFRMHMMGKRVNYACRSVITPDPYLDIDEIGIPELFARKLTFPEPVSHLNMRTLRSLIRNGPELHPGANFIELAGKLGKPPSKIKLMPGKEKSSERGFQSTQLHAADVEEDSVHDMPDTVLRHLHNGDRLLMNRQPSLHKPSIMGHRTRVLRGQNALRMNYAPCKAYNADFDGDEMNGHFVQNRVAQCEAAELANVGSNFLVPKDGTPILGLIQDHVVSGVLMTLRGRFFDKEDFMHLLLSAFAETTQRLRIPPPAILWPKRLWSGKQVITAIVHNCCPADRPYINLMGKAKTSVNCWKARNPETGAEFPAPIFSMSESEVVFRNGELLCGVLDKAHYGATQFGLIHCCYELYGPKVAVQLLSCFSRSFTTYLQFHGFSLGVADILVTKKANKERRKVIRQLRKCGDCVIRKAFGLTDDVPQSKIRYTMATVYNHPQDKEAVKVLDYTMKQTINKFTEQINNACVPSGLIRDFPTNALQLMIQSGSKGSLVNSIQISCALGQIELEGKRPPRSIMGRSLPSFPSFDPSPRAGGFIEQRFLTGIDPQELFFHTMAGREGLVDTAVKTSRSGYLQRCIIKHLEGITVRYDHTVRDYDNSIIQFRYGEDGLDVGRSTFINAKQFPFLHENSQTLQQQIVPPTVTPEDEQEKWHLRACEKHYKRISKFKRRRMREQRLGESLDSDNSKEPLPLDLATMNKGYRNSPFNEFQRQSDTSYLLKDSILSDWKRLSEEERAQFVPKYARPPEPVDVAFHPCTSLGALSERMLGQLNDFVKKQPRVGKTANQFKKAIYWKGLRAFADPGECVGLLAAQSIGEPSTQMTLNTFHFAGRGEMNVTLGIPRLREILMTQSKNISTPMAEVCIHSHVTNEQVEQLKCELNPVRLRQVLRKFTLDEKTHINVDGNCFREYILRLDFFEKYKRDPTTRHLNGRQILREVEASFGCDVAVIMAKRYREVFDHQQFQHRKLRAGNLDASEGGGKKKAQEEDLASDEEDAIEGLRDGEADASEERLNKRHLDDMAEYEGEEQDRGDAGISDADENDNIAEIGQGVEDTLDSETEDRLNEEDGDGEENQKKGEEANKRGISRVDTNRVEVVLRGNPLIVAYSYDAKEELWCQFTMRLPLRNKGIIDVMALIEREVDKFVVTQVRGVSKCVVREEDKNGQMTRILQTQGVNLEAFYFRSHLLDTNTIYSNDIDLMLRKYGVEAAARTIVKEMNNVFGVYGIEVNPRHLTLTADYMTFTGCVQAFNRGAMAHASSPLQKMTFETTVSFMQQAIIDGQFDSLFSPSARLVLGQLIRGGTGAFDLHLKYDYALKGREKKPATKPTTQIGRQIQEMRERRRRRRAKFYHPENI